MLPNPSPNYQVHPETAKAALFTFSLAPWVMSVDAAPAMTFAIQQPGRGTASHHLAIPRMIATTKLGGNRHVPPGATNCACLLAYRPCARASQLPPPLPPNGRWSRDAMPAYRRAIR